MKYNFYIVYMCMYAAIRNNMMTLETFIYLIYYKQLLKIVVCHFSKREKLKVVLSPILF